jgi:hypothetical protein
MYESIPYTARHWKMLVHLFLVNRTFVWLANFPNSLLWCSEMCEAWSQKWMFNNDSRHAARNGELWLTRIKVQAQHLSKHW